MCYEGSCWVYTRQEKPGWQTDRLLGQRISCQPELGGGSHYTIMAGWLWDRPLDICPLRTGEGRRNDLHLQYFHYFVGAASRPHKPPANPKFKLAQYIIMYTYMIIYIYIHIYIYTYIYIAVTCT